MEAVATSDQIAKRRISNFESFISPPHKVIHGEISNPPKLLGSGSGFRLLGSSECGYQAFIGRYLFYIANRYTITSMTFDNTYTIIPSAETRHSARHSDLP